jgi:hypothetical protein
VIVLEIVLWIALGLLAWTHVLYPIAAAIGARIRPRVVRKGQIEPMVSVIIAAHDEESVIERRLENLLALDYPADRLEILIASDASTDRTDELVEAAAARDGRVRLLRYPRGGQARGPEPRVPRGAGRDSGVLGCERDLGARRAAQAGRELRRSGCGLRVRPAAAPAGGWLEPRRRVLALRDVGARQRVGARLGDGWERLDLRRAE